MENVIIVGSGPAGLTAAIYTARAFLKPLLITGTMPGGQLTTTSVIENFPGFPEGIDGRELMDRMQKQAEHVGARIEYSSVTRVELVETEGRRIRLHLDSGQTLDTKALIVATGASALTLDLPQKDRLMGYGLSTCAVCDGFFYRGKRVGVVGGGDSAMEEALYLARLASEVFLFVRRDKLRASKVMQEKVLQSDKIKVIWKTQVVDTKDDGKVLTGVVLKTEDKNELWEMPLDGLFMAIGHKPNTEFLQGVVELDEKGYIITHGGCKTSVEGIFAAGDVEDQLYRQAITAAGRGCQAALEVERYLEHLQH